MSIETHIWPNGFRLIYQKSNVHIPVTNIQVFCDVGSAYESADIRGASHMVEHMCFKGTKKIPTTQKLMIHYDRIGAYFNAYTKERYTCYVLKCDDEYVFHSMNIMSDMILNSRFGRKEFIKEERVVIEENIQDSDDPVSILMEETNKFLYDGSSFMYPVDTVKYHLKKFDYDNIVDFYKSFYHPSRMIISVVSNLSFHLIKNNENYSIGSNSNIISRWRK